MIEAQLKLKFTARPQRSAAAVLLPGGDPRHWVQLLRSADVALEDLRLLPIQTTIAERAVAVLCPVTPTQAAQFSLRIPRYGVVAGRLYVPIEAAIEPPVADSEWSGLLPQDDSLFVWHPRFQLIRCEADYQIRPVSLFRAPAARDVDWNRADAGTAPRPRLISLSADALPTIEQVLSSGQDDIGLEADERFKAPPADSASSGVGVSRLLAAGFGSLASLADWIRSRIPSSPQGTDFYDRTVRWLRQMAQRMPQIEREREREIRQLLEKLERDPDEGLKFALPMSGMPGRGTAVPGSRLTKHDVNFRLNSGSGGPADAWMLDDQLQQQLLERYRAAAERELNLRRFRRAAYIHAELLGDFHAAASDLEQGQHYHEAAAVYRDRLSRPLDAARCLERGGLLQDAIEIYTELGLPETVGELYLRLEQPDAARTAFEEAVSLRLNEGDRLAAAGLLQSRLDDGPAALEVLWDAWPDNGQASACLNRYFELLGEAGDHSRALQSIDTIRRGSTRLHAKVALITAMSHLAGTYPHAPVREHAADATRLLASESISRTKQAPPTVMRALEQLAPGDRLLARDCRRFKLPEPTPSTAPPPRSRGADRRRAELVRQIAVPDGYRWLAAESVGQHVYLIGHDDAQTLILFRSHWSAADGHGSSRVTWSSSEHQLRTQGVLLGVAGSPSPAVRIASYRSRPFPPRMFPRSDQHPQPVIAQTPGWLKSDHLGLACCGQSSWTLDKDFVLTRHTVDGVVTNSVQLAFEGDAPHGPTPWLTVPIPMHGGTKSVSLGLGSYFYRVSGTLRAHPLLQLPSRITEISGSRTFTRERILVTHDTGASLLFPTTVELREMIIETDATDLRGLLLGNGHVVLWAARTGGTVELRRYLTTGRRAELLGTTAISDMTDPFPLKLLRTHSLSECAVIPREPGIPIRIWNYP